MPIDKRAFKEDVWVPTNEAKSYDKGRILHSLDFHLFSHLGIDRQQSERGRDENGALRFYELTEAGELKDPFTDGSTLRSDAFLDKASKGRIIAFPAGEKQPVQLQIHGNDIGFSKPMETLPIPQPQEPQRLSRWARFANAITFGRAYRAEKAEYQQKLETYQKDMQGWQKNQDSFRQKAEERTPEVLERETKQLAAAEVRREEAERQAKLQAEREKARKQLKNLQSENPTYSIDQYRNTLKECYGPKPVFHEEFSKEHGGESYTKAQFDVLQDYSGSIDGAGISDEEFTAIAMFGAFDPAIGSKWDPEQDIGLTPEESTRKNITMFTDTVNALKVTSRPSHGKIYERVVQPAREKTVEAIQEYIQGNPEKLARQIGEGMHMLSNHYAGKAIGNELFLSVTSMMGDAMGLLERNPKLKAETERAMMELAAKDSPNATPEELKAQVGRSFELANGQKKAVELTRRNEKAKGMLKAESLGLCELSKGQRKEYIDDRLAFETVQENTANDIYLQEHDKTYLAEREQLSKQFAEAMMSGDVAKKNRAEAIAQIHTEDHIHAPEAVIMMGKSDRTVGAMVDSRLPNKDKLYELSGEELEAALKGEKLFAKDSPYTQKQEPEKNAPDLQKTAEKTMVEPSKDQCIGM